jgi:hypothetical protein
VGDCYVVVACLQIEALFAVGLDAQIEKTAGNVKQWAPKESLIRRISETQIDNT